jgi:uncharacterized protein (DUF3084 family)
MGTAIVFLLLLTLCGFIAYIGDLLGRRLGKKRLSVFGLRPKHTAILLTVVTGVLIAAVTFGVALASVSWFRLVVTKGERLAYQNLRLTARNKRLEKHNQQRATENSLLEAANGQLQAANTGLKAGNERLQSENRRIQGRNQELTALNRTLASQSQSLRERNSSLQTSNRDLRRHNSELAGGNNRLKTANTRLQAATRLLTGETHRLRGERSSLAQQAKALRIEIGSLREDANNYREKQYIFRRNEQIRHRVIPPDPPLAVLRRAVEGVVSDAERDARTFNPKLPQATRPIELLPPAGYSATTPGAAAILDWIVRNAAEKGKGRPLVVRVLANENAIQGRPVRIRVEWYANELVYRKGAVITRWYTDGGSTEGSILGELIFFLKFKLSAAATAPPHSMIPTEQGLGELSYDQLLDVSRQVKQMHGPVWVVARARQDTLRAGPLHVELEVSPFDAPSIGSR